MDRKVSVVMLALTKSAGVTPEVNPRNPLVVDEKAPTVALKPGVDITRSPNIGY